MDDDPTATPHSARYLTDARDLWWNRDFLGLISTRVGLASVQSALDVGAGLGHFTRTVATFLPAGAAVIGVERDPQWVAQANATKWERRDVSVKLVQGDATALPFDSGTFDLVTCQTLLIHLADPAQAVREMMRVLKKDGVLLCAEPNNLGVATSALMADPRFDLDDVVAAFRFQATCERGKHALGLGYNSLGENLVGLLPDGMKLIGVWNNDRCEVYERAASHADRTELINTLRMLSGGGFGWDPAEALRYFVAGGGDASQFEADAHRATAVVSAHLERIRNGGTSNSGGLFYVMAARKDKA